MVKSPLVVFNTFISMKKYLFIFYYFKNTSNYNFSSQKSIDFHCYSRSFSVYFELNNKNGNLRQDIRHGFLLAPLKNLRFYC